MRFIATISLLFTTALLAGCPAGGPTTSDKDVEPLDYRQVEAMLASSTAKSPVVLVDLRSPEAFAKGSIPGAINIPMGELSAQDPRLTGAGRAILFHEQIKGDYPRAFAKKLLASGIPNVFSYAGGYQDWLSRQAEGKPAEEKN